MCLACSGAGQPRPLSGEFLNTREQWQAFQKEAASCQREEGSKCVGHQEELIAEANTGLGRQQPVHRTELLSL